jgi:hypothetical protein
MINFTSIEDAIHSWATSAMGIPVIWAKTPGTQPPFPYGTLDFVVGPRRIGSFDPEYFDAATEEIAYSGVRELILSCQVYALPGTPTSRAQHYLSILQDSLSLDSIRDILYTSGVTIGLITTPVGLNFKTDTGWVSRANMDITVRVVSVIEDVAHPVTSVGVAWVDQGDFTVEGS